MPVGVEWGTKTGNSAQLQTLNPDVGKLSCFFFGDTVCNCLWTVSRGRSKWSILPVTAPSYLPKRDSEVTEPVYARSCVDRAGKAVDRLRAT